MLSRLLPAVRWTAVIATFLGAINLIVDALGKPAVREAPVWLTILMLWILTVELIDRRDMRRQVMAEVDRIKVSIDRRMDAYERHTLGHLLSDKRRSESCTIDSMDPTRN